MTSPTPSPTAAPSSPVNAVTNVTVLGTGVLGSQIAFQAAFHGFAVTAYDVSDEAIQEARGRFAKLADVYEREAPGGTAEGGAQGALASLTLTSDLAAAVADADLVIEAVPESLEIKRDLYTRLKGLAPAKTIFATNSSTLLPSDLKDFTDRPSRFLALHYANRVWAQNTGEIMGTPETDPEVYETVVQFASDSGLVPIRIKKEQPGYVLNSLLVPFLDAAAGLLLKGVADVETIDATWKIATGAPFGPFQIFDVIGLTTPYNVSVNNPDPGAQAFAALLKRDYIDKGKLGVATGEGFYRY